MSEKSTYFVRHGRYNPGSGHLTRHGQVDAERAGLQLYGKGIPATAVILSSTAPRALETAAIIQHQLASETVYSSDLVEYAGLFPRAVRSLRKVIDLALTEAGVTLEDQQLIVVTHEPLLLAISERDGVQNGEIIKCDIDTWTNDDFSWHAEETYLIEYIDQLRS